MKSIDRTELAKLLALLNARMMRPDVSPAERAEIRATLKGLLARCGLAYIDGMPGAPSR